MDSDINDVKASSDWSIAGTEGMMPYRTLEQKNIE